MSNDGAVPAVTIATCDDEPIHIPGSIQSNGCLLACDPSTFTVLRHSANAADMLQLSRKSLLGSSLADVLGVDATHAIRNAIAKSTDPARPGLIFSLDLGDAGTFDVSAHLFSGAAIIELRPGSGAHDPSSLELSRTVIRRLSTEPSLARLVRLAPRLLRLALNYDRVMIYRFSPDGAGQVISEAKREDLESFSGQWFPATDIPVQARALYLKNTIRVVSDARGDRVPIVPELDASGMPLDLSFAHLRSVSPIHCEYLRNMGVAASMSVSIVVGGKLWGLIACHHYSPRALTLAERVNAEMFGDCFSMQVEALVSREMLQASAKVLGALDKLMQGIIRHDEPEEFLRSRIADFRSLVNSDGVAIWLNGELAHEGDVLSEGALRALAQTAGAEMPGKVWSSHRIGSSLPLFSAADRLIAGALAIPLSQTPGNYLFYFRKEVVETIQWAGDPNKSYDVGPNGARLTPRGSFAVWKETVRGQSNPWSDQSRQAAEAIRVSLMEIALRQSERLSEERKRAEVRQKVLNDELNHRVKNILALIRSLLRQTRDDGRSLAEYAETLEGRIMALATAHDQILRGEGGGVLSDLINAELLPYKDMQSRLEVSGPPVALDARAFSVMALVIHELTTNAAKYGALSRPGGTLKVSWILDERGACDLRWEESGGPAVASAPGAGFGTSLIERSVPFDLQGEASLQFETGGVRARFLIPHVFVSSARRSSPKPQNADEGQADPGRPLEGKSVLLVEDQFVIAMDAEEALLELGAREVFTAASSAEALKAIEKQVPDFGVLDINLGNGTSAEIADALLKLEVPFIFATGYGESDTVTGSMSDIPVVRKPYSFAMLSIAATQLAAMRRPGR